MKKNLFLAALAIGMLASCADNEYVGEITNSPNDPSNSGEIVFGLGVKGMTRGDIYGNAAAELLGNNFYVTGTKGTEANDSPTPILVFDNYLVHYGINTAGTTESNTANWEYVGVTPGTSPYNNYVKLSTLNSQTIKYWDFSADQYDFLAFSTGTYKAVATTSGDADEVGVTAMKYGTGLASSGVAYTFDIPSEDALSQVYISDITEVLPANYGQEVSLKFKNLGSKVRMALYETVPGYSVKDVMFYTEDGTTDFTNDKGTDAALITAAGIPTKGQIAVYFPHVGNNNDDKEDYDKASATVTPGADPAMNKTFGALTNQLVAKEFEEAGDDNVFLGRSLPTASFAGEAAEGFYLNVFPVSTSAPLTLRVDYTLVPIDGAAETIEVKGAKAVVPATYTKWLPNYAYTYIFKISDNTNGWTGTASQDAGLFPITFDAVVAEATDATGEQATITTVATPTITTYQQGHTSATNEYSKAATGPSSPATVKNVYVQVMENSAATALLKTDLNGVTPEGEAKSLLYAVDGAHADKATEALVMDALEKRTAEYAGDAATVIGRNGITLTKSDDIDNTVTTIVNGVDDNVINLEDAGKAAMLNMTNLAAGTYAYVYDYTASARSEVEEYQPIDLSSGTVGESGKTYKAITVTTLDGISTVTAANETVDNGYIYFSKTKNGGSTWTYSYVSVAGKTTLPAGLIKVAKSTLPEVGGGGTPDANTFYFETYFSNNGSYAVKIIKIVA